MQVAQATYISIDDGPKPGMAVLRSDGRKFIGKHVFCRKFVAKRNCEQVADLVWFFNEVVYYELATLVSLKMPDARILVSDDGAMWFGSEYHPHWQPVQNDDTLRGLCSSNVEQLTLALILDLLLFNNDRTIGPNGDIFCEGQELFFIDHGHSLWGDGRCFGDLHRVEWKRYDRECERYDTEIVKGYIKGFLHCAEANDLVLEEGNWPLVQQTYRTVRTKIPGQFKDICGNLDKLRDRKEVQAWKERYRMDVQPRLVKTMARALDKWASELDNHFEKPSGREELSRLARR